VKIEDALTLPEAARKAGMSGDRLRRRLLTGEIAGELHAGRWFVDPASLSAYLAEQTAQPSGSAA
jgi:hypothetical protein